MTKRVLVVEGDAENRDLMVSQLTRANVNCYGVTSGEQAVELAEFFDLILMGTQLPGISGLEAAMLIRKREKAKTYLPVSIVAVTGEDDREKALTAGMNAHFCKPISDDNLLEIVKHWLPNDTRKLRPLP